MYKLNKLKIFTLFILIILFSIFFIPSKVFADKQVNVIYLDTTIQSNGKINFVGVTDGSNFNGNLLVKIFDGNTLEFFDQVTVVNNLFEFSATPKNTTFDRELKIVIDGDLSYRGTLYYSYIYNSEINKVENESLNLLDKYSIYYDDNISIKLKFNITTSSNGDILFVYLNGINFRKKDENWLNKDKETWNSFLSTITTQAYEAYNKKVYVYIYDQDKVFLEYFPEEANNAIKDNNIVNPDNDVQKNVITQKDLTEILKENKTYYSGSYNYTYNFTLESASSTYIKINAKGDFSNVDNKWAEIKLNKLEAFFDTCAIKINDKYNVDIDFFIYDKNNKLLTSYSYYTFDEDYEENKKLETSTSTTSSSVSTSNVSTSVSNPVINEEYKPSEDRIIETIPKEYELDPKYQFIAWNDKRATGLVLALSLTNYGYNSVEIIPTCKEETSNSSYVYNMTVDGIEMFKLLDDLRHDTKKIAYIKYQTDSNNISLNLPKEAVSALKQHNALFIFDTDCFRLELDFDNYEGFGPIKINIADTILTEDDYAKPFIITIKDDNTDASSTFEDGIKCLIHYESEKTKAIKDLRSINVYDSNGMLINSTSTTLEKGFIFRYNGPDTYFAKNIQYNFLDDKDSWKDSMSERYAELVVSKGIMDVKKDKFNPSETLTRAEFITYIANKLGAFSSTQRFNNIDNKNPYYEAINGVYELGIMPSIYRENLDYDKEITREEMIYMIVRCYEINNNNKVITSSSLLYRDKSDINIWAKTKIGVASKLKLIDDDGYLYPKDIGTKEFAANLFYKLLVAEGIF